MTLHNPVHVRLSMMDVIRAGVAGSSAGRDPRMSDDQLDREHRLQAQFYAAVAAMRSAIQDLNAGSSVVRIDAETFDNLIHDEFPSQPAWTAKINEAR